MLEVKVTMGITVDYYKLNNLVSGYLMANFDAY